MKAENFMWAALGALAIVIGGAAGACMAGCKPGVDVPKAAADISNHQVMLDKCKAEARDAGKVAVFDACVKDAGAQ
jgi:hypothetical protein